MNVAELADFFGVMLGFILTIMIFSYIFGDNPLFRLAIHIFIGVASGFALVVVFYNIFWNQLLLPLIERPAQSLMLLPPLLLGLWLLVTKGLSRFSRLGNPVMAFLVGAGVAAAIGGSILGTLLPQIWASGSLLDIQAARQAGQPLGGFLLSGILVLVGTVSTLAYFHFGTRQRPDGTVERGQAMIVLGLVGQGFIAITFGVLFAGVYSAALAALIERMNFIVDRVIIDHLLPLIPVL
jgi:hypothetical protein